MDLYYKHEVSVGLLVLIAIGIFAAGSLWLAGTPLGGGRQTEVHIQFEDVGGLAVGDPVLVSGFNVGRVSKVDFQAVGRILTTIELREDIPPHADASAAVGALDFLGAMKVDYQPGTSPNMLAPDAIIIGSQQEGIASGLPELKDQAASIMMDLQGFLSPETADNLNATLVSVRQAMNRMTALVDGSASGASLAGTLQALQSVALRIDSILANPKIDSSVNQLDEILVSLQTMTNDLSGATSSLSAILEKMQNGQGSIGMALTDTTLHHDAHELLVALTELVDDMKERPGRYFHLKVF